MKLILKEYLAGLRERDELDALIPDLLSQMGMTVFTRPGRGTRQDGVDVGAVGFFGDDTEKVFLFSIKSGDLSRKEWDSDSPQALRPSLNEIKDSYLRNRLPAEHMGKPVVICLAFGGDIQEQVRTSVEGYIKDNTAEGLSYSEWNGDFIASLILENFLGENLISGETRVLFRKSLALIDEPEASVKHFKGLVASLTSGAGVSEKSDLTILRQLSICSWSLLSWARSQGNLEAPYLSTEFAILHAWPIVRTSFNSGRNRKHELLIKQAWESLLFCYRSSSAEFIDRLLDDSCLAPHVLSSNVRGGCSVDINLKMYDLLGRFSIFGLWAIWDKEREVRKSGQADSEMDEKMNSFLVCLAKFIESNPALKSPLMDEQGIDIFLASQMFIRWSPRYLKEWVGSLVENSVLSFQFHGAYPCIFRSYGELLKHEANRDEDYRREATSGSILYPILMLFSSMLGDKELCSSISRFSQDELSHCNMQYWFPDDVSEDYFYNNEELHGSCLSDLPLQGGADAFIERIRAECCHEGAFGDLSAVKSGYWPLILVACRHYRIPPPLHFMEPFISSR